MVINVIIVGICFCFSRLAVEGRVLDHASVHISHEVARDLFGDVRAFSEASEQSISHPRVLFDADEWTARVESLARNIFTRNTFSYNFVLRTWAYMDSKKLAPFREEMTDEDISALVEANAGETYIGETEAQAFFVQAQRAFVFREMSKSPNFSACTGINDIRFRRCVASPEAANEYMEGTKRLLVNWARFFTKNRELNGALTKWNIYSAFEMGGAGFVLALDVMFSEMSSIEQEICRTAVSNAVGDVVENAETGVWGWKKPISRIWSNWAGYNSQIYLLNCVRCRTARYNVQTESDTSNF